MHFNLGLKEWNCPHKNPNCADTGAKFDEVVNMDYGSHPSPLEGVPSHVVCQLDGFLNTSAEATTTTQQDEKGVLERVSRKVMQLADIQM